MCIKYEINQVISRNSTESKLKDCSISHGKLN